MRVIALMEAYTVTGPAKNLLRFCRMARAGAVQGCDISIVTFVRPRSVESQATRSPAPQNQFIDEARASGVHVDIVTERGAYDTRVLGKLRKLFREQAPDVIQTHSLKSHGLVRMTRRSEARWIAFHHGYTATDLKMRVYNQLDRWSLPTADRVVTVCAPFADQLAQIGVDRERIRVLPNAIDWHDGPGAQETAELRREWNLAEDARVLLAIGRLSREKGHVHLIQAAHLLRRNRPALDFQILLVGDGPERAALEAQTAQLGLQDRVRFTGHQHDPLPFYALADMFVLPSLSEGSPNVLLEAMMVGTPIVATAVGGVPDTVRDGRSAMLVPAADPAALANSIGRLMDDPALAESLKENARADVRERHSPQAYCTALTGIYRELLGL
jgi:glycosyltransferase involved in cell wall biosynthesis